MTASSETKKRIKKFLSDRAIERYTIKEIALELDLMPANVRVHCWEIVRQCPQSFGYSEDRIKTGRRKVYQFFSLQ